MEGQLYSSVCDLVEEASEKFGDGYVLNDTQFIKLEPICNTIEELADEFDYDFIDIDADDVMKRFVIGIECNEIVVEDGRTHKIFDLFGMVDAFCFSKANSGMLRVDFFIENLWGREIV